MSARTFTQSTTASKAYELVSTLQRRFVNGLESLAESLNTPQPFQAVEWLRDEGRHGGGIRFETADGALFGRGSVNVSQVHYDDDASKKLGSASAISTIIHPSHPLAPSVHIHISWTEMKDGNGYWRMMADLNPSIENPAATGRFLTALEEAAPEKYTIGKAQGERYFYIPALERHRGVAHFYLESYRTDDAKADARLAKKLGKAAIDTYLSILHDTLSLAADATNLQQRTQLDYHTLYFFQVLTLDRGTTSGLLIHDQNDVGIMGSLPAKVDKLLLQSWVARLPAPQNELLEGLIAALPESSVCLVDEAVKTKLAAVIRQHYKTHPEAIAMQASGDVVPPTVKNHC